MTSFKQKATLLAKNLFGWTTKRRIVVFSVDDFGNVRIASKNARENLKKFGLPVDGNRFDQVDCLETGEDLSILFDTLTSVRDCNNRSAVFTAFALPANIDFDRMAVDGYQNYFYQLLPDTLNALPGYEGTWHLWTQGMSEKIFVPQFHGREHVNIQFLQEAVKRNDSQVMIALREKCWAALDLSVSRFDDYVSAFSYRNLDELENLKKIAIDGLNIFEKVFGYRAVQFNSPGGPTHSSLEIFLKDHGIKYLDSPFFKREYQGKGRYRNLFRYQGKRNNVGQLFQIRNCIFEPLLYKNEDSATKTLMEIDMAFKMNKPAVITSHRVNFCGSIDQRGRDHGIQELKRLLISIKRKWPSVEFMAANELSDLMAGSHLLE